MKRNYNIRDPNARVKALITEAEKHEIEIGISLKVYFRAAQNLIHSMYGYLDDNDIESAYILASKFIILFIEKLPKHPDYKTISIEVKSKWNQEVNKTLKGAEKMKLMILEMYEKEEEDRRKEEKIQLEINKLKEQEMQKIAEKQWLDEQENKLNSKEKENIDYLENFLTGTKTDIQPSIDRSLKPISTFGVSDNQSTNPYNWRTLVLPNSIFDRFLKYAQPNTDKNIETCGILCGKISAGKLIITTVALPKQRGTSDSCATECEEELFDYVDRNSLITLGWIHTHPTQTAFLSSVDLHTQLSYQIMLPEAIAIVCSPKYSRNAFFSLTPDYGVDYIKNCRDFGFHPHPSEPKLFEESPHVCLMESPIEFCDLRGANL